MTADQPAPYMERVLEIPADAVVQLRSGDRIIYTFKLPAGPARVTIQYMAITSNPKRHGVRR